MPDSMRYADWFKKSTADLSAAKILIEHGGDNAVVAFLCQQAIEKKLKGFILKNEGELVEGHSLVYLCRRSAAIDASAIECLHDLAFVNQFYIETRYPADVPLPISLEETQRCVAIAEVISGRFM